MAKNNQVEIGVEFSKLRKKIGTVNFKKLKQPKGAFLLASLDFDYLEKPNIPKNWNFHVCTGNAENHDHYLLSYKQAEELYAVLGKFLCEYDKKFKKPKVKS
jgi:hypothetical protein